MSADTLTAEIARALGLPWGTTKAVLTLEPDKLPTLELTVLCLDSQGKPYVETSRNTDGTIAERLAQVQFMLRLERFPE